MIIWECSECAWKGDYVQLGFDYLYNLFNVEPEELDDPEETTELCPECRSADIFKHHI